MTILKLPLAGSTELQRDQTGSLALSTVTFSDDADYTCSLIYPEGQISRDPVHVHVRGTLLRQPGVFVFVAALWTPCSFLECGFCGVSLSVTSLCHVLCHVLHHVVCHVSHHVFCHTLWHVRTVLVFFCVFATVPLARMLFCEVFQHGNRTSESCQ